MTVQTPEPTPDPTAKVDSEKTEEIEGLGEAGKKALDKIREERDAARRDAKAHKGAADELAALKAEKMTEAEKTAAKLAAAEQEVATVPAKVADALKSYLVKLHNINDEDAELFLTATDPELLLKQVDRLAGPGKQSQNGNRVIREGNLAKTPEDEMRATARSLFGGGR